MAWGNRQATKVAPRQRPNLAQRKPGEERRKACKVLHFLVTANLLLRIRLHDCTKARMHCLKKRGMDVQVSLYTGWILSPASTPRLQGTSTPRRMGIVRAAMPPTCLQRRPRRISCMEPGRRLQAFKRQRIVSVKEMRQILPRRFSPPSSPLRLSRPSVRQQKRLARRRHRRKRQLPCGHGYYRRRIHLGKRSKTWRRRMRRMRCSI